MFQVQLEDGPHADCFGLVDDQLQALRIDIVAEEQVAAGPLTLPCARQRSCRECVRR